ncbi:MAG: hypothetical protein HYT39_02740 [Candidatus Sungbacteria bacterium]|nr:hypothetical protein [Candidatus Sungbacteria bacterium]
MNKKIIISIIFLVLLSSVSFVSAISSGYNLEIANINIQKGWNLVPLIYDYHIIAEDSDIKLQDIKVAYMYPPIENKYVKYIEKGRVLRGNTGHFWISEEEIRKIIASKQYLIDSEADARNLTFGMSSWVYINKTGNIKINIGHDSDGDKILISGWSFLIITPEMIGKNLSQIKGGCDIIKSYAWWAEKQTWDLIDLNDAPFDNNLMGMGIIVKVSNDCVLSSASPTIPPPLPN